MTSKKPCVWGPKAWYHFHVHAIIYPDCPTECEKNDIIDYYQKRFLKYVECETCVKEYLKILRKHPIRACSKMELFMWSVDVHNFINQKIKKPCMNYTEAYCIWQSVVVERFVKKNGPECPFPPNFPMPEAYVFPPGFGCGTGFGCGPDFGNCGIPDFACGTGFGGIPPNFNYEWNTPFFTENGCGNSSGFVRSSGYSHSSGSCTVNGNTTSW